MSEIREVPLGRSGLVALVDEADYPAVADYTWCATRGGRVSYAVRQWTEQGKHKTQLMHSLITGWPRVDHANHDGLDNRRVNLRLATATENARNSRPHLDSLSRFKGVTWDQARKLWKAQIWTGSKQRQLGRHRDEEAAARAYDAAARELFGEFAHLNFGAELAAV